MNSNQRRLGDQGPVISPLGMGCWPIAGMSSSDANEADSLATLAAAFDAGINFYDTAFNYGMSGEADRLIAKALGAKRDKIVLASKGGLGWTPERQQVRDASPTTLRRQLEESLRRLQTDHLDLFYLHAPDLTRPIEETAGAFAEFQREGKIRAAGLSNCSTEHLRRFHAVCPLSAYQPHYNMLQREIERDQLPWCVAKGVAVVIYWPLLKGLLTGKFTRDHVWDAKDSRKKYPMFQGHEWLCNLDFLDELRGIANGAGVSVSQLVLRWTIEQPGITAALCGAKRADQIRDNAGALAFPWTSTLAQAIADALARRGQAVSIPAVSW